MPGEKKMTKLVRLVSIGLVVAVIGLFLPAQRVGIEGIGTLSLGQEVAYASPDVEILRPDAPGDECNISGEVGADCPNHYLNVDEAPPDENATCVFTNAGAYQRDLYNIANHSVGSGTINSITVYARCGANFLPFQPSLKLVGKTGGTVIESDEITVTFGWANYSRQVLVNPQTGNPWTWDEIDNLQIGVSLRRPTPFGGRTGCTQVWVAVDYTPPTIDVTAPASASLGNMIPGTPKTLEGGDITVTVDCNVAGWSLGARDARSLAGWQIAGHMDNVVDTPLTNALKIKGGDQVSYIDLSAIDVLLESGDDSTAGITNITDVNFQQLVEWADPPGSYSIIVTFIGSTIP